MTDARPLSVTVLSEAELRAVELAAVRAWPAAETRDLDGWLWRHSGGQSQRANSVSTLAFRGADPEAVIDIAEALYHERGAPARFQVSTRLSAPADLDQRLERRGYRLHEPVSTLVKRLGPAAMPAGVDVMDRPDEQWMEVYLSNITPDRRPAAPQILASVPEPRAFLTMRSGGKAISTALGVLDGGIVIAECVGTRAEVRRQGGGGKVMLGLESWAGAQGAKIAALQAVAANRGAQALYASLGYNAAYGYHYRILARQEVVAHGSLST